MFLYKCFLMGFFLFCLEHSVFAKKTLIKSNLITKEYINQIKQFKIVPFKNILEPIDSCLKNSNTNVSYRSICESLYFEYPEFSIAPKFPNKGYFQELFIVSVPNSTVQGKYGHIFIDNKMPQELVWSQRYFFLKNVTKISEDKVQKIKGKVAVIAQFGYQNYFHWINEILGRLAILEIANIEYDWLYVSDQMKYAKETLELWGIDNRKIISAESDNFCIQADELIVPSLVSNTTAGYNFAGTLVHPVTMNYVRQKLLQAAYLKEKIDIDSLPKKIFISRKDSYAARKILNEDEVFSLFEAKGFVRYELSKLSVAEQIILFNNADIVISEQGSGLSNILFCKSDTHVVEIFQSMIDNCFWWQSSVLGLKYFPILTVPVDTVIFSQCDFTERYHQSWLSQIDISLNKLESVLKVFKDVL